MFRAGNKIFMGFVIFTPSSALNGQEFDKDWPIMQYSGGASVLCKVKSKLSCTRELVFSMEGINANEFQSLPPDIVVINCDENKVIFQKKDRQWKISFNS